MIVNVNPYDTGFDENSHVMRFAALAREVSTVPGTAPTRTLPAGAPRSSVVVPHRRSVTLSTGGHGKKVSEAHLEVLEGLSSRLKRCHPLANSPRNRQRTRSQVRATRATKMRTR